MNLNEVLNIPQYSLRSSDKSNTMFELIHELHKHHLSNCSNYSIWNKIVFGENKILSSLEDFPYIPVSAFKNYNFKSIPDLDVYKVLTSSGTTGQDVSKIYLDKETAKLQSLSLSKIIGHVIGNSRLPMLIIDSKSIFSNKQSFSARGAGILGLSVFGKEHTYVLNEKYEINEDVLSDFLEKNNGRPFLIFGFTFMIWLYLYQAKLKKKYDLSQAILIHSGGWKKLNDQSVDNETFKNVLRDKFMLINIYNFYGMVEQVGSVFLENAKGYLHCPNFADVLIRNPVDFSIQPHGKEGLIQVISALPRSYPGHSLLTEDIGVVMGEDDLNCGWNGKYFKIIGRAKKAELRGCSDTFNQTNL